MRLIFSPSVHPTARLSSNVEEEMRPMQSRIISACGLGWRAFHALLVRVMFTSPVLANHGGCSCLYVECDRFGGDKRWCQSVAKYLHIVGILVGGSMGGLSSPGCYCRRGPVRGLMLSVSLVLPAYHSRGLGGQGEPLLCLLFFVFHVRGMIVRGGVSHRTIGGSAGL